MRFPHDVPVLTDGLVTLRAHREDDIPSVVEQCQDPHMARWTSVPQPYSPDDAKTWIRHVVPEGWETETCFEFALEHAGVFAGSAALRPRGDGRAEIGYGVHPSFRRRGVMARALRLLVEWGFTARDLETITWSAFTGNWPSRRLAWRLGFSLHGPVEKWVAQRGELQDAWVGVLRREDPREPRHPWYDAPTVVGPSVVLRAIHHGDAVRVAEAFSDETSQAWLRVPATYSEEEAHGYVEERRGLMADGKAVYWTVADPQTDDVLGAVMLFNIEPGKDAELGYWMHPDARGRGTTVEAARLAVRHAFVPEEDGGLGLARLTAYAGVGNAPSVGVIDRLGFTRYGVERLGGSNGRGESFDLACHDLLASEFRAP
ncbi:MAG TPA: GNAT family N-acetyltransferase [Nocardioidaceae bacterium]|nr:GNAT family N-acetyltransferase [Nocardioidaceae bacterium]